MSFRKLALRVVSTCINSCIYLWPANHDHSGVEMHFRFLCYRTPTYSATRSCPPASTNVTCSRTGLTAAEVNLTGDYIWAAHHSMSENIDGMRALRLPPDTFAKAA